MNFKITTAAVLAIAGAAAAAPFSVSGTVDFGGPGNAGAPLTVGGGIISVPATPQYAGPGNTGIAIAPNAFGPSMPTLTAGSPGFSLTSFEGGYFMDAPVNSGTTLDGRDGVFLMHLIGDFSSVSISSVFVEITDGNGTSNVNFTDFNLAGDGGSAAYELVIYQPNRTIGEAQIWVVYIPSPASAGLIGLAGIAATRRRR